MLYVMGGAVDLCDDKQVLKEMLNAAKGADSKLRAVTSATGYPEEARQSYSDVFNTLGVKDFEILHISDPQQANDPVIVAQLDKADIIFFTGGDQVRLTQALSGTRFMEAVNKRYKEGCIIAGTSAGSAAMSERMIYAEAPPKGSRNKDQIVSIKDGFGFSKPFIIDTHFSERGRLGRLFRMVTENPGLHGIGVDEDTVAIIRNDNTLEVSGAGTVTIVDGVKQVPIVLVAGQVYNFGSLLRPGTDRKPA